MPSPLRPILVLTGALLFALAAAPAEARGKRKAPAPKFDAAAINAADLGAQTGSLPKAGKAKEASKAGAARSPLFARAQILLDRARFSPGSIDGRDGENFEKALKAFATAQGLPAEGRLTPDLWAKLVATSADPAVREYTTTKADAETEFVKTIPPKMEKQADLDRLGYRNAAEMLSERFHMDPDLLRALNPGKDFSEAGIVVQVANTVPMSTGRDAAKSDVKVARIEVDKGARTLSTFDKDGKLVAVYPASIGSEEKPAPSGTLTVERVAPNPTYTYNPKYAFKGVKTTEKFTIKPGPNNPVGVVWIALSADSYGIHGTPEPEKVGKTESHGCVRLTNWDVRQLAAMVEKGTTVDFKN